jgi:4-hydroxy-3-methylbut-2-enyl diphosphate reductase IspH
MGTINANQVLERIQTEIQESKEEKAVLMGLTTPSSVTMYNSAHDEGYLKGLERAMELVKRQVATEGVETIKTITVVYELQVKSELEVEDIERNVQRDIEKIIIENSHAISGIVYSIASK